MWSHWVGLLIGGVSAIYVPTGGIQGLERIHADTGRAYELHTERPRSELSLDLIAVRQQC